MLEPFTLKNLSIRHNRHAIGMRVGVSDRTHSEQHAVLASSRQIGCAVMINISANQISESTADNHVRRKMFMARDARGSNRRRQRVEAQMQPGMPARFVRNNFSHREGAGRVAGGHGWSARVILKSVRIKSAASGSYKWPLAVGCEFQNFRNDIGRASCRERGEI